MAYLHRPLLRGGCSARRYKLFLTTPIKGYNSIVGRLEETECRVEEEENRWIRKIRFRPIRQCIRGTYAISSHANASLHDLSFKTNRLLMVLAYRAKIKILKALREK